MCRSPQYSREEEEPGDKLGCPEFTEGLLHQAEFSPLNFTGFRKTLEEFWKEGGWSITREVLPWKCQMGKQMKNRSVRKPQSEFRYRRWGLCLDSACEINRKGFMY